MYGKYGTKGNLGGEKIPTKTFEDPYLQGCGCPGLKLSICVAVVKSVPRGWPVGGEASEKKFEGSLLWGYGLPMGSLLTTDIVLPLLRSIF